MFARQQLETEIKERRFLRGPCRDVISRTVSESELVESSWWLRPEIVREFRGKETSAIGSRYRGTASEEVTVDTCCVFVCV
jgi:hypothetical protein